MYNRNKRTTIKLLLLLYINLAFVNCTTKHTIISEKNTETIDLSKIQSKIDSYTKGHEQELREKGNIEINQDSLIVIIAGPNQDGFYYIERNTKTGRYFSIQGNKKDGFETKTKKDTDKVFTVKKYYGNGNINSIGKLYIEGEYGRYGLGQSWIEFPLGKKFTYDKDGNLIEAALNYDKMFKYSYSDLIKFFKKKKYRISEVRGTGYPNGNARWRIFYRNSKNEFCEMIINANNGKVYDHQNIQFVE